MIHLDLKNKVVTTPACILGPGIKAVAVGIEKLVARVVELAKKKWGEWVRRKRGLREMLPAEVR
jgi:hypothetical protein